MNPSNEFVRALDSDIPLEPAQSSKTDNSRFHYRSATSKLIWPMIKTHPELSYYVVKLTKFASSPASIHYDAVFGIFQYLSSTRDDGLAYTRTIAMNYRPLVKHTPSRSNPTYRVDEHIPKEGPMTLFVYSDSDWAMDIHHRRSISGKVFFLSGAFVTCKTSVQPTVVLSTADSEFLSSSNFGCLGLFIRAVLDELKQSHTEATYIYEDNDACRIVANSLAPTKQMQHIAIHNFALQDWTEHNPIALLSCSSNDNALDMFTEQVSKFLFAHHNDNTSGRSAFFRVNPLIRDPRPPSGARGG
jgi:hypothetical protein